jgi:hypothetical protein
MLDLEIQEDHMDFQLTLALGVAAVMTLMPPPPANAQPPAVDPNPVLLVSGLAGGSGSTVGPEGALYVTEPLAGRVSRVDPRTGAVTAFASGLPPTIPDVGVGGAMDVAFIGSTAYVLVTLVGTDVGGDDVVGIYRVDGPNAFSVVADIGEFSSQNPPSTAFFVPTGVQYALQSYRGGFLVTDGHHNRVLRVTRDGEITQLIAFDNIVPTGLAVWGDAIYMTQAGPIPHLPQDGKVVSFGPTAPTATEVASGASLLVDVEFGRGRRLYALSQGPGVPGAPDGAPAQPNTGALVEVTGDATLLPIVTNIDRPTSLELMGTTAFVVTLTGEIWRISGISGPPFGVSR